MTELASTTDSPSIDYFVIHGFVLWTVWGVISIIQISANRYMKGAYWESYLWIHRIAGTIMTLCTIFYATYAFWQCAWVNYQGTHGKFAFPTLYCVSAIAIGGVLTRILLRRCKWRTRDALCVKTLHRIFAYLLIIVGNGAVFTGIKD